MAGSKPIVLTFPISVLSSAYKISNQGSLRPMLKLAYFCHIGLMEKRIPDYKKKDFWERIADYYHYNRELINEWVEEYNTKENFICKCKAFYDRYSKKETMPYTSMSTKMYIDFWDNDIEKSQFEKDTFIAYLALKSIIGDKKAGFLKWELLLSRMAGETKMRNIGDFPEAITKYNSRKLRDKLRNSLIKKWKVQYYFIGRKPWYSLLKEKKFSLQEWVEEQQKSIEKHIKPKEKLKSILEITGISYRQVEEIFEEYIKQDDYELSVDDFYFNFLPKYKNLWQDWKDLARLWIKNRGTP